MSEQKKKNEDLNALSDDTFRLRFRQWLEAHYPKALTLSLIHI